VFNHEGAEGQPGSHPRRKGTGKGGVFGKPERTKLVSFMPRKRAWKETMGGGGRAFGGGKSLREAVNKAKGKKRMSGKDRGKRSHIVVT